MTDRRLKQGHGVLGIGVPVGFDKETAVLLDLPDQPDPSNLSDSPNSPDSLERKPAKGTGSCYPFPLLTVLLCLATVGTWMLLDELLVKKQSWGATEALWVLGALALPTVLRGAYLVALYMRCRMTDEGRPESVAEARARLFYWLAVRFQALGEAHECGLAVYRNRLNRKEGKGKHCSCCGNAKGCDCESPQSSQQRRIATLGAENAERNEDERDTRIR